MRGNFHSPVALSLSILLLSALLLSAALARIPSARAWIAGDSMAPALKGPHYRVACSNCGFPIECSLAHPPPRGMAVCPNCGERENAVGEQHRRPPDRVAIVPLWIAGPVGRFDVIAFRAPASGELAVKRVLGLPGETPAIRNGNVTIDGRTLPKPLAAYALTALPVHDAEYRAASRPQAASSWMAAARSQFEIRPGGAATLRGTIRYRHRPISVVAIPSEYGANESTPIRDFDAYNQSLSRPLAAVSDGRLSGRFRLPPGETVTFAISLADAGTGELTVADGKASVHWTSAGGRRFAASHSIDADRPAKFSLAIVNGRFLAAVNGKHFAWADSQLAQSTTSPTFEITASEVQLPHLRIDRDLVYLHANGTHADWSLGRPLREGEYFVLGDNPPASTDSRQWSAGIGREEILGKVFRAGGRR